MNGSTKEWIVKAEHDYATAGRELQVGEDPNFDAICFHAQQCVEKLMKCLLIHLGAAAPKSHDLVYLNELLTPVCKEWSWPVQELRLLSRASVEFRYPGESADREEAEKAFDIATRLRAKLQSLLVQ